MAQNEWINGYLEAILDVSRGGGSAIKKWSDEKLKFENFKDKVKEESLFSPTKYFVQEVITSFDESDLHRTWIKVIATKNSRERSNRLENMCWRIWHLARKKKQ